ncbi:Mitogen-activated protein kinase kinase kinase 17, partial [Mucuna pruriens]
MAKWKNLTILGKGSYATVYLATITHPEEWSLKIVAVKRSRIFSFSIDSLAKEKRILESFIGCKEILQFYFDQFTIKRNNIRYNLFMEFAPYGSLGDLIKKRQLSESEVRIYTQMILKGLCSIHQKGVVHCDLKPDNILLFSSFEDGVRYQLKIADFGLSKTREETNANFRKFKFKGTPIYMSPESVVGIIETPLDIWSLGCIVIEMITGFHVWRNIQTRKEIMLKLAFHHEAPEIPNELSWECKNFLSKCFVKDHKERWTAAMLLNHPFLYSKYKIREDYQNFPRERKFNNDSKEANKETPVCCGLLKSGAREYGDVGTNRHSN